MSDRFRRYLKYSLIHLGIAAALVLILNIFVFSMYQVNGASMEPTIRADSRILISRLVSPSRIRRFDLVVFEDPQLPGEHIVKRVIGLPGERISIRSGRVYVNGKRLIEPYTMPDRGFFLDSKDMDPLQIPRQHFYILGDNRRLSKDSRDFGSVSCRNLAGRIVLCYWPLSEFRIM